MSAFNTVETDYTLTCADGLGTFTVNANLQVNGNIQYSGTSTVSAAFVLVGANNTGAMGNIGLQAQSGPTTNAAIRFSVADNVWQLSPNVNDIAGPITPYANILTSNDAYGNSNVAVYLPTYTGNLSSGNLTATGLVSANSITATTANITGNTITVGVFTDNYYYANGNPVSFAGTYNNSNVAAYLPTYSGNLASLTGNVTTTANIAANYFIGDGSQLTGITSNASFTTFLESYTGNITCANIAAGNVLSDNYFYANGLPIATASLVSGDQQLSGDGVSNTYVLSQTVANVNSMLVAINGVIQYPGSSYTLTADNVINFAAPPGLTDRIDIRYLGLGPNPYGNTNVAAYLPTYTGDIQANNISLLSFVQAPTRTIPSSSYSGIQGQICWDASYIYVCVAPDTWSRVALDATPW